jgi:hypothetical protein
MCYNLLTPVQVESPQLAPVEAATSVVPVLNRTNSSYSTVVFNPLAPDIGKQKRMCVEPPRPQLLSTLPFPSLIPRKEPTVTPTSTDASLGVCSTSLRATVARFLPTARVATSYPQHQRLPTNFEIIDPPEDPIVATTSEIIDPPEDPIISSLLETIDPPEDPIVSSSLETFDPPEDPIILSTAAADSPIVPGPSPTSEPGLNPSAPSFLLALAPGSPVVTSLGSPPMPHPSRTPHLPSTLPAKGPAAGASPAPPSPSPRVLADELGQLVLAASQRLSALGSWEQFVVQSRGPSDLCSNIKELPHPAAHLLGHLEARGAPVVMKTGPWSTAQTSRALRHGPHKSALEHIAFLHQELVDMIHKASGLFCPQPKCCT